MKRRHRVPAAGPPGIGAPVVGAADGRPISRRLIAGVLAAACLGLHLASGDAYIRNSAATYDEPVHLASGYSYWMTGRYRLNIMDHPPLAEMVAAIPLLTQKPLLFLQHPAWLSGRLYDYSDFFLYHNRVDADRMLDAARRFAFWIWTGLLAWGLLSWTGRISPEAMVFGAILYAFNPALLSNLPLVDTDGGSCVLFFLTIWIASGGLRVRNWARWSVAGLFLGLANAAKFNMILLGPIVAAAVFLEAKSERWFGAMAKDHGDEASPAEARERSASTGVGLVLFAILGLAAVAAVYRFGQFSLYIDGLTATLKRLDRGRSAYLWGRHSTTGFGWYFPFALAVKIPLATWILAVLGWRGLSRRDRLWAGLPPLIYFAGALTSKVQIGYRHVLPVVPFLIVWAAGGATWLWSKKRRMLGPGLLCVLLTWQVTSVFRVHPFYLAYFNEVVGGPSQGYRFLADSNVDWGQDLKSLGEQVKAMGNPPIYLSYFGTADPAYYGLHYLPVAMVNTVYRTGDVSDPSAFGKVVLAVSATNLDGVYYDDHALFDWLKTRRPLRAVGWSVFLYDLTSDPDGIRQLANVLMMGGDTGAARALLLSLNRR